MASGRVADVQMALQRVKRKISELQQQLKETSSERPEETSWSTWTPSEELRDSLVDMYTANPRVNEELRQRLPSPAQHHLSSTNRSGISLNPDLNYNHNTKRQAPQHLQEFSASCSSSPPTFRRSASPASPPPFRRSASPSSPRFQRRSVSLLSSRLPGGPGEMDLSPNRGPSSLVESCGDTTDERASSRVPGSPGLRRHLVPAVDSSHQASASSQGFDGHKNISFLLKELDGLREINSKLQEQLVHKDQELQRREVEDELREEQRDARDWERPAAVLEEVLMAQKDRDQALMSRLLLANEERDEALLRVRRLQQATESETFHLDHTHQDVDELLRCICDADSAQEVQEFGSALVQHLQLARRRRSDITAEEMKVVMEERDSSLAKCKRLEQEMLQDREQRVSQELLRLQRERDGILEDRRRLEAEIQTLRTSHRHSLRFPSMHSDSSSSSSSSSSLSSQDVVPPFEPSPSDDNVSPEAPPLMEQLQQLVNEKQSVEAELQRCQEAEREASERIRRLERLVDVLRKKVGTGSVRAVI